eukprot:gnl/Spiro4/29497_TR14446_c0_g1_i1.p1 gnl/Spiro4/29497_TR14446_c0_g1~~gnl/Spiro4/29497_TR14446_c0_g1_i1.p1  ORF type:complete len:544 (+),score=104.55 gnl/Spiro4/29497_TR14446_c0_g1_i1:39-1634(+)
MLGRFGRLWRGVAAQCGGSTRCFPAHNPKIPAGFYREVETPEGALVAKFVRERYPLYVAGVAQLTDDHYAVQDKYSLRVATHVCKASSSQMEAAIAAADASQPQMAALPLFERKAILNGVARELTARADELAVVLSVENGKPVSDATVEVLRAASVFEIAAEEAVRPVGEYADMSVNARSKGYSMLTKRFPVGPIAMISPFNFPLNLSAHKIAPAIAAGCPFILKPSDRTPITSQLLGEILSHQPAMVPGAFSCLPCDIDVADALVTDPRLKMLSFTGSPGIGWALKKRAGKKKVVLELGGNAAAVVHADCGDLDYVASRLVFGAFFQAGQSCISVQRVLVHESIYDDLKRRFAKRVETLVAGDPLNKTTFVCPLISLDERTRVEHWVNQALQEGARVVVGHEADKMFYKPTILENVKHSSKLWTHEVFGPVAILEPYSDFRDAISRVNDSAFGLQAGVFTQNLHRAHYAFEHLHVGGVVINDVPSVRLDSQPYGGIKDSGVGREGLRSSMEEMTEIKVMLIKDAAVLPAA